MTRFLIDYTLHFTPNCLTNYLSHVHNPFVKTHCRFRLSFQRSGAISCLSSPNPIITFISSLFVIICCYNVFFSGSQAKRLRAAQIFMKCSHSILKYSWQSANIFFCAVTIDSIRYNSLNLKASNLRNDETLYYSDLTWTYISRLSTLFCNC